MLEKTYVASASRLSEEDVLAQGRSLTNEKLLDTLDSLQGLIAVVNSQRQVVFANKALLDFAGAHDPDQICGLRPGEILNCIHAHETPDGCGTSESCRFCGAAEAIVETQRSGTSQTRECRITGRKDGTLVSHEFSVRTIQLQIEGADYVLVSFRDVSHQKRRAALERVFFHDVLNTISALKMSLDLLKGNPAGGNRRIVERLDSIADALEEQVTSQRLLLSAENGTLKVQRSLVASHDFVKAVIREFDEQDVSRGKTITVAPFGESFALTTDHALLHRVLANMIRNALEASRDGETVTVGFSRVEGGRFVFWVHNPGYMEEYVQRQVFQRSFSTKGEDRGLGTYSMLLLTKEYLHGDVRFESTPAKGTTFHVILPAVI